MQECTTAKTEREDAPFCMKTRRRQCEEMRGSGPVAFALSLLLLALQLLGLGHLALERHGVCWEHGTLTELGTSRTSVPAPTPGGALPGLYGRPSTARLDGTEGHHHCPVQASRRDWGAPFAGNLLALAVAEGPGHDAAGAVAPRADAGLLRRAPKQSPPGARVARFS
jgi:hypothetical protein